MNVIARVKFELAYCDVTVQQVSHYTTWTLLKTQNVTRGQNIFFEEDASLHHPITNLTKCSLSPPQQNKTKQNKIKQKKTQTSPDFINSKNKNNGQQTPIQKKKKKKKKNSTVNGHIIRLLSDGNLPTEFKKTKFNFSNNLYFYWYIKGKVSWRKREKRKQSKKKITSPITRVLKTYETNTTKRKKEKIFEWIILFSSRTSNYTPKELLRKVVFGTKIITN